MKKLALVFLFNVLVLCAFAQESDADYEVHWSEPQKSHTYVVFRHYVGHIDGTSYGVYSKKAQVIGRIPAQIASYNEESGEVVMKELKVKMDKKKLEYEAIIQLNDQLHFLTSCKDKKNKQNLIFLQNLNPVTLEGEGTPREIASINYDGKGIGNDGSFGYVLSRDSTKILMYYEIDYSLSKNEKRGFHVFDQDFNLLWEKEVTLPFDGELFDVKDVEVANNGDVHVMGKLYEKRKTEKRGGEPNYTYHVLSYQNEGKSERETTVKVEGKFLKDMKIAIDLEGNVICTGFYSEEYKKEEEGGIKGTYFMRIDHKSGELIARHMKEFGLDLVVLERSERMAEKIKRDAIKGKSVELKYFKLNELVLREDGGVVLIAEADFMNTVTRYSNNSGHSSDNIYSYKDILIVNISPLGEIEWATKIDKLQRSRNDQGAFSSYALTVRDDKMYFLFNDPYGADMRVGNGPVVMVTVDQNGQQEKEQLSTFAETDVALYARKCGPRFGNKLLIYGENRKKYNFGSIKLPW
jgi:hypothetical protein